MAEFADVCVLQPIPVFPALRPKPLWARERVRKLGSLEINHLPMFYVPGVLKSLDGHWLARSIRAPLSALKDSGRLQAIDAHFGYPEGVGCAIVAAELDVPYFITIRGLEIDVLERSGVRNQLLEAMRGAAGLISVSHSLRELVVAQRRGPAKGAGCSKRR